MGRIAEALKRAQQERQKRQHDVGDETARPMSGERRAISERRHGAERESDPLSKASILNVPALSGMGHITTEALGPEQVDPQVVVYHDPTCDISERYRSARTRLLTDNPTGVPRSLAIASSSPKDGKTITTANLSFSLAELRQLRIACVDLDFRQRGLSTLFKVENEPGICEVLRGENKLEEVCRPVVRENLILIPAGNP